MMREGLEQLDDLSLEPFQSTGSVWTGVVGYLLA